MHFITFVLCILCSQYFYEVYVFIFQTILYLTHIDTRDSVFLFVLFNTELLHILSTSIFSKINNLLNNLQ